jgi:hypothetical protein
LLHESPTRRASAAVHRERKPFHAAQTSVQARRFQPRRVPTSQRPKVAPRTCFRSHACTPPTPSENQ